MKFVFLRTEQERTTGLIGMRPIPDDTIFVFAGVVPGSLFHSQGVLEPFDLVFVDSDHNVLAAKRMVPPNDVFIAPPGTADAWEAKARVIPGALP